MKTKITLLLLVLLGCINGNAQSFLVSFPNHASAPLQNPRNLTVCNSSSLLKVRLDVAAASTAGATVTIQLPSGVEYLPGTITKTGGTAALTIADNGGGANAPNFLLGPSALIAGQFIEFTIDRKATCASRTAAIAGTSFTDVVTGTIPGQTASTGTSSAYQLFYPVFSLTQPATQTNAVVGQTYTRTFTITNGGNGCTNEVSFSINNTASGVQTTGLTLGGVAITPTSTVGTTSYYTVTAANLPGGDFCFGETLTFTETYIVKSCNAVTNYAAGWGCGSAPASWCQTVSGSGSVAMVDGSASLTSLTVAKVGYVNDCTPYQYRYTFVTAGSNTTNASAIYNAVFRVGGSNTLTALNAVAHWGDFFQPLDIKYNGQSITPVIAGGSLNHLRIEVNNKFTTDPDGAGVGFEDLDGDGFYDDLLPNSTVVFTVDVQVQSTLTCQYNLISGYYNFVGDVVYTDMCNVSKQSAIKRDTHYNLDRNTLLSTFNGEILQQQDNSYAPGNIFEGVPFRMRFAESWYAMGTMNYNPNQRYEWTVTLPAGVNISGTGNITWANGKDVAVLPTLTPTYTFNPVTRVLTVLSPGVDMGMFYIDLVYDCASGPGGAVNIPYKVDYINDYTVNCRTYPNGIFCGSYTLANVKCLAPCPDGGFGINYIKVEREDNSLGWTNSTMTTLQTRSNISDYDLSKALYLDDFMIKANGIQQTIPADNLHIRMSVKKLVSQTTDIIQAKSIDVIIKRAGVTISTGTINAFTNTGSTNTKQFTNWNLTSLVPSGGMLPGDVVETVSHYSVIAGDGKLPTNDIQTGDSFSFYNIVGGIEKSCDGLVPEMYLVATGFNNYPTSGVSISSCTNGSIANTPFRNFAAAGNVYINEYRPGFMVTGIDITVPSTLTFVGYAGLTPTLITPVAGGTTYHFDYTSVKHFPILTGLGTSGSTGTLTVVANCSTPSGNTIIYKFYGQDYYYHYAGLPTPNASTNNFPNGGGGGVSNNMALKPAIAISNQTGTVQAARPIESTVVRISSTGGSTAPNIWIKVPTQPGVTVTQVVNVATSVVSTPIAYAGGVWFQVSTAGIAPGNNVDYRIDFTYTTCTAGTIHVEAGWDCAGYPSNPDLYICTPVSVDLPFIPQTAEVQIITVTQPTAPVDLCTPIPFEYRMNSAGAGNTVANKFIIDLPVGMAFAPGSLQAEYPVGSGNWQTVTSTTTGTQTTVDLTTHTNYPAQGLPGTLTDGGNANSRLMGLRFSLTTDCNFIAGTNINIIAEANRSCGAPAAGNGTSSASLAINVNGVAPGYFIVSNLVPTSGSFNNCNSPVVFGAVQTVVSSTPTGSSGTAQIILPPGYNYVAGSYICNDPDLSSSAPYPCATFNGVFTNTSGQLYIELGLPAGMVSGDKLNYGFAVEQTSHVACSAYRVTLQTVDQIAAVTCSTAPGGVCSNIAIATGSTTYDYTISNPVLAITNFNGTYNAGTYTGSLSVNNTSAINQTNASPANPVQVGFYCADASGNPTGSLLGSYTMTGPIAAGATVTENYTLSGASACGLGKIVAVISTDNNCICDTVIKALDLLPIATNNSQCYTQGALSTTVNVLANDTTGDIILPTTVSLVVPSGATGVVTDAGGDVVSMTIAGQGTWSVNATTGEIVFVPLTNTTLNPTPVQYYGDDAQGNTSNNATITLTTTIVKVGTETTTCLSSGYTLSVVVNGLAPYTVTGTGAPGTWSGNTWTSSTIATGTNYNVSINDVNSCNTLVVSGTAPVCCVFQVTCPTFTTTTVACYANIPTATTLTETQFEALGNADGIIGNNPCGVIVITASNAASPACEGNVIRTYTITEYADPNNNDIRDAGENTVLNTQTCSQTYTIERNDFTMPINAGSTVACAASIVAPTVPVVTDNCGNTLTPSAPVISATPTCEGNVTYTYTFTDCEGNTHNWVYTYTIDDTIAPTGTAPANLTFQCIADVPVADVNSITDEADNCNGGVIVTVVDTNNGGSGCLGSPYIVTRTFTLTDCSGLQTNLVQTITVQDTTAPVLVTPLSDATATCSTIPGVPVLQFTDNCSSTAQVTVVYTETTTAVTTTGSYVIVRTWDVTDACGNASQFVQNIAVTIPNYVQSMTIKPVCNTDTTLAVAIAPLINNQFPGVISPNGVFSGTGVDSDGIFKPYGLPNGNYLVTYNNNDPVCPRVIEVTIPVDRDECRVDNCVSLIFHNALTPNGDGLNDTFVIENLEVSDCYSDFTVEVFNRWGVKVYSAKNYNNADVVFKGESDARATLSQSSGLPTGTYYYIVKYKNVEGSYSSRSGYLYLTREN